MSDAPEDWPVGTTLPGSTAHLVALGAFALWYNEFEMILYTFLRTYFTGENVAARMFASMHNRGRVDLIKLLAASENEPQMRDALDHAMKCFDICAENRNLVLHALPTRRGHAPEALTVLKATTSDPYRLHYYDFTLKDLQEAASAAERSAQFAIDTVARLRFQRAGLPLPPWHEKPPLPRKLSLSRRRSVLPDETPLP
ncbi:MAG: hypothetical protein ACHP9T_10615 [Caulobacterales bacterium]